MNSPLVTHWRVPLGGLAVSAAVVGAVLSTTPPASSQSEPDTVCSSSDLTVSGPLLRGCERENR